jgi:RNA polymerase sigma-70 factor (ECF subfamily)
MENALSAASESTSQTLLRRAQQHDGDAWQRLAQLYTPLVYGWSRRAGLQRSDAADVGQDVFRTLALKIADYQPDRGSGFRAWLWGITRNKLREFRRRRAAEPQPARVDEVKLADIPEEETGEFLLAESQARLAQRALEVLQTEFEERTWQAFWRSAVEEHKTADIAADLQMTVHAVRQARYRVLCRLRQELDEFS